MKTTNTFQLYCNSLTEYSRYPTQVVQIGGVAMGGDNPIRIQSMTTTNSMDTSGTVDQVIRMVDSGTEYVRITTPNISEAQNLASIKKELLKRNCKVPLIADIHYTPNAAEVAAGIVEKVRINPGNYVTKKSKAGEFTEKEYFEELEKIGERLAPLLSICKENGTAMRIGVNHGSLSERILERYGDTPLGMVESAMEFLRICEQQDFSNIVVSMKASNPIVMVHANRLLVNKMEEAEMNYPLHLGVTEAGAGEDGRIRSAIGIGALLEDGIGDTIRVSLTEPPENELPVAKSLCDRYHHRGPHKPILPIENCPIDPFSYTKRSSAKTQNIGGSNVPIVIINLSNSPLDSHATLEEIGYFDANTNDQDTHDIAADYIYLGDQEPTIDIPNSLSCIYDYTHWKKKSDRDQSYPLFNASAIKQDQERSAKLNFVHFSINELSNDLISIIENDRTIVPIVITDNKHGVAEQRRLLFKLMEKEIQNPVVLKRSYNDQSANNAMLYGGTDLGSLLIDGFADGVWLEADIPPGTLNHLSFGILQATRTRITKTEFVSCPSCGRTLFDLEETTQKIKEKTDHLKGVKIAIMGCIVNGPGEMADADYGYVGSGRDKITLYRNKEVVKKNLSSDTAYEELVKLIKEDGKWIDK